jgi:hypothetical protein
MQRQQVQAVKKNLPTFQESMGADNHIACLFRAVFDRTRPYRDFGLALAYFDTFPVKIGTVLGCNHFTPIDIIAEG